GAGGPRRIRMGVRKRIDQLARNAPADVGGRVALVDAPAERVVRVRAPPVAHAFLKPDLQPVVVPLPVRVQLGDARLSAGIHVVQRTFGRIDQREDAARLPVGGGRGGTRAVGGQAVLSPDAVARNVDGWIFRIAR